MELSTIALCHQFLKWTRGHEPRIDRVYFQDFSESSSPPQHTSHLIFRFSRGHSQTFISDPQNSIREARMQIIRTAIPVVQWNLTHCGWAQQEQEHERTRTRME